MNEKRLGFTVFSPTYAIETKYTYCTKRHAFMGNACKQINVIERRVG